MGETAENTSPAPSISHYRFLSAVHFGLGFLLLFFATYTAMKIHGEGTGTFPYYVGSFMTCAGVITVSLVGVAIYDVEQHELGAQQVPRLKPRILAHVFLSSIVTVICVVGFTVTIMYGICPTSQCSYSTNETFNYGMAVFLMFMQLLCFGASVLNIVLFVHFKNYLIIHQKPEDRTFSSRADIQGDIDKDK